MAASAFGHQRSFKPSLARCPNQGRKRTSVLAGSPFLYKVVIQNPRYVPICPSVFDQERTFQKVNLAQINQRIRQSALELTIGSGSLASRNSNPSIETVYSSFALS